MIDARADLLMADMVFARIENIGQPGPGEAEADSTGPNYFATGRAVVPRVIRAITGLNWLPKRGQIKV